MLRYPVHIIKLGELRKESRDNYLNRSKELPPLPQAYEPLDDDEYDDDPQDLTQLITEE